MENIYTHNEAASIVELFENILDEQDVTLKSPEDDDKEPDNAARLYGSTYSDLMDTIESRLIDLLKTVKSNPDIEIIEDKFSGNY